MYVVQGDEGGNDEEGDQYQSEYLKIEIVIGVVDGVDEWQCDVGCDKFCQIGEKVWVRYQLFVFVFIEGNGWY